MTGNARAGLPVAVLQSSGHPGDPGANLRALELAAGACARAGDRLLVTPELYVSGYNIGEQVRALACDPHGDVLTALRSIARRHDIALCVGYPQRGAGGVYNAAVLIRAGGDVLGHYRKHRLSGAFETAVFARGDGADLLARIDGICVGVLICYDAEFPENVRRLARRGAKLVLVPTALSVEFAVVAEKVMPTRAFENGVFVAYADRCGSENAKRYAGRSCIVAPDGVDLARAGADEALIRARVEPAAYAALEERLPYLRDLARD